MIIIKALRLVRNDLRRALIGRGVLVLSLLAFTGCAPTHPQLSQDDWIQIKTRTYPGVTSRQVVAAAEQLFRLADGSDTRFTYNADGSGMKATRTWLIYLVLSFNSGYYHWDLKATDRPEGTWVGVDLTGAIGAFLGPGQPVSVESPAAYYLFWSRMDYLLGRSTEWRTCAMQDGRPPWGTLEPLCLLADDLIPDGAKMPAASPPPAAYR
jgi:hypothetical protein